MEVEEAVVQSHKTHWAVQSTLGVEMDNSKNWSPKNILVKAGNFWCCLEMVLMQCLSRCSLPGQGSIVLPPLPCTSSVFLTSETSLDSCCMIRATDLASYPTLPTWCLMSDSVGLYCLHSLLPFFHSCFILAPLSTSSPRRRKEAKLSYFIPVDASLPTLQHICCNTTIWHFWYCYLPSLSLFNIAGMVS